MAEAKGTQDWPELFVGLYDRLTGSNAEISYSFDGLEIEIPSSTGPNSPRATWRFTGTMRISTRDTSKG